MGSSASLDAESKDRHGWPPDSNDAFLHTSTILNASLDFVVPRHTKEVRQVILALFAETFDSQKPSTRRPGTLFYVVGTSIAYVFCSSLYTVRGIAGVNMNKVALRMGRINSRGIAWEYKLLLSLALCLRKLGWTTGPMRTPCLGLLTPLRPPTRPEVSNVMSLRAAPLRMWYLTKVTQLWLLIPYRSIDKVIAKLP